MRHALGSALLIGVLGAAVSQAQTGPLFCSISATNQLIPAENLAAPLGDVIFNCSGGTNGAQVSGNLSVFLNVALTNRLAANNTVDALLTIDTGSGPTPSGVQPVLSGTSSIAFNGVSFTIPSSRAVALRVSNLRGAAGTAGRPVNATIAFNGSNNISFDRSTVQVGNPAVGLQASFQSRGIPIAPATLALPATFANLISSNSRYFSTRVTEGFATAFLKKDSASDAGTRILVRLSGFPSGAKAYAPDVVTGSNTVQATAGGDLGVPAAAGQYASGGNGSLLLVRVSGADASGAGGSMVYTHSVAPGTPVNFATSVVNEITLDATGAGTLVYEVADADPTVRESAQFPIFWNALRQPDGTVPLATQQLSFAPSSTVTQAAVGAPIPRFLTPQPPSDCTSLLDCSAAFFPRLAVSGSALQFTTMLGTPAAPAYVQVNNAGAGNLIWNATVSYTRGADWLRIDPASGRNNATIRVDAIPTGLAAGLYDASLTIDAGPLAGSRTVPVQLQVTPGPVVTPRPAIAGIGNAALPSVTTLVAGNFASIFGTRFSGGDVAVTFDGLPARVTFSNDTQINLRVPAELGIKTSAQMVVQVGALQSDPFAVTLGSAAPAIFSTGVLNQDYSQNSTTVPAAAGSVLQVFLTGLPPASAGLISVRIHDRQGLVPLYAADTPQFPGLQQVNVAVPADLPDLTTTMAICIVPGFIGAPVCTPAAPLSIRGAR